MNSLRSLRKQSSPILAFKVRILSPRNLTGKERKDTDDRRSKWVEHTFHIFKATLYLLFRLWYSPFPRHSLNGLNRLPTTLTLSGCVKCKYSKISPFDHQQNKK